MQRLTCTSTVRNVVVHARGALVSRAVALPSELPAVELELAVPGVTPLASPGAMRALAAGDRKVLGVRTRLLVPTAAEPGGELRARVLELEREADRLETRRKELVRRRGELAGLDGHPALNGRSRKADPKARFGDALAVQALLDELTAEMDRNVAELDAAREAHARVLAAARADFDQATTAARALPGHPTWEVTVQLAAGGRLDGLQLLYPVAAARWWPAYAARVDSEARSAEIAMEAFVAQASFEDWKDVSIALSTADMAADARLPELASMRIGRAQPARRTGYRPPPPGLDDLFGGYDAAMSAPAPAKQAEPPPPAAEAEEPAEEELPEGSDDVLYSMRELSVAPPAPGQAPFAVAAAAPAMPAAPRAMMKGAMPRRARMVLGAAPGAGGGVTAPPPEPEEPAAVAPEEAWLDFDALMMATTGSQRGRLTRRPQGRPTLEGEAAAKLAASPPPPGARDPLEVRGQFDHRFDGTGLVDVPSTGVPHRILLCSAKAPLTQRFRTTPREAAEVFREATLANPFPAPMLGGPLDLFVDGTLVATVATEPVGRGGLLRLGLGVESRLRVARNARVEEKSRGVLGGKLAVEHEIDVELGSALGQAVEVEVLDRLPVTDEKDAEVTLLRARPESRSYDQSELGAPVRGGLRWTIEVPAGGSSKISWSYRIELPAKCEIVGGNRRE